MSKPPKIVVPGLNRGAGIAPGYVIGRRRGVGRGPAELLDLPQLQGLGLATGAQVAQSIGALSTALSATTRGGLTMLGMDGEDGQDGISLPGTPGAAGAAGPAGATGPQGPAGFGLDGQDADDSGPIFGPGASQAALDGKVAYADFTNFGFDGTKINFFEFGGPAPSTPGPGGLFSFGADDTGSGQPYMVWSNADGVNLMIVGSYSASGRFQLAGSKSYEFSLTPYVGLDQIYHEGNLSFGTGLSYAGGVLTASGGGGGGSVSGLMWAGFDGQDADGWAPIFGPGEEPTTAANVKIKRQILQVYSITEVNAIVTPYEMSPTKPAAADFTLQNGAGGTNGATIGDYDRGVFILQNGTPGATGQIRFARHNTVSVGQAFTMTARLGSMDPSQPYAQAQQGALILRNSANGRMILYGNGNSDVNGYIQIFSSYTSGQLGQYSAFSVMYQFPWKRIVSDGTNLTFFASKDGYYWVPSSAGTTIANYLGALDEAGIGVQSIPTIATPHGTVCQSFTFV